MVSANQLNRDQKIIKKRSVLHNPFKFENLSLQCINFEAKKSNVALLNL
jgi:hypothetical protein|tara:strand:- start:1362 stop:1508 length:147 start_codon:yes stop_codon:yes gene_type:complete